MNNIPNEEFSEHKVSQTDDGRTDKLKTYHWLGRVKINIRGVESVEQNKILKITMSPDLILECDPEPMFQYNNIIKSGLRIWYTQW